MSYFFLFLLLLLGGSMVLIENPRSRQNVYAVYLYFALPLLLLFGGLRTASVDADYGLYNDWFSSMVNGTLGENPFLKDPSFAVIGFLLHDAGLGIASLIFVYCALCLGMQILFASKVFDRRWMALGIFLMLCRFFIPHELTQIRSAVAIPLMSLAVISFLNRRLWRGWILLAVAVSFHFSAIISLPLCLILALGGRFGSRMWVAAMAVLGLIGYFAFARVAVLLAVFARTSDYVTGAYDTKGTSLLSIYLLCRLAMVSLVTVMLWKRLDERGRLLIVCSSFGIMLEVALASNDALSIRSGELFGLFDIASALMILSFLRVRTAMAYVVFLLCLGGVFFRSTTKIVQPYTSRLLN